MRARIIVALLAAALLSGCASGRPAGSNGPASDALPALPMGAVANLPIGHYIKHVVVIIQENRSFDNMFQGYPGADTQSYGYAKLKSGKVEKVDLTVAPFEGHYGGLDLAHGYAAAIVDCDAPKGSQTCANDGYWLANDKWRRSNHAPFYPYSYLDRTDTAPYWTMAQQYVLADKLFPTEWGPSFTAHIDLVAANTYLNDAKTLALVDSPNLTEAGPWGCDSPDKAPNKTTTPTLNSQKVENRNGPFPCFTRYDTLAKLLDNKKLPWKFYAPAIGGLGGIYNTLDAIKWVRYGSDWTKNVISPQTKILTDLPKQLAAVTWITPTGVDSDHPHSDSDTGPSWVANIVNAVGESPYWKSTAIVVLWDDWGGWYDHVLPPQLDFLGLGYRVPMLVISPYAKKGYVDHTQFEFGSILKFQENVFSLPSLGFTDQRATGLSDAFDFSQKPRAFQTIPCKYPPSHFINEGPSNQPVDDDKN
ncbi:MAG: alkaline phosphatase family protein [Candidatus Tumulicola sp.]